MSIASPELNLRGLSLEVVRNATNLTIKVHLDGHAPVEVPVNSDTLRAFLKQADEQAETFQRDMELVGSLLRPTGSGGRVVAFKHHGPRPQG